MFCRISRFQLKHGQRAAYLAARKRMYGVFTKAIDAEDFFVVDLGADRFLTIGIFRDELAAKASEVARDAVFDQLSDYIDLATVESRTGEILWKL